MTSGDPGIDIFLQDESSTGPVQHSVFRAVDQRQMLERLDAMEDEELADGYLAADTTPDDEATAPSFDAGIRALVGQTGESGRAERATTGGTVVPGLADDPAVHRAFVLGGPGSLSA